MTTQEIAASLVDFCRRGEFEQAQKELYSNEAISVEPFETPGFKKEEKGIDKIIEKGHRFMADVSEVHSIEVSEPMISGNSFAVILNMDITMKQQGRIPMKEICVYEVKDDKIVSEHFFM